MRRPMLTGDGGDLLDGDDDDDCDGTNDGCHEDGADDRDDARALW